MNPSTEDMLNAIEKVNAKTNLYFPGITRILSLQLTRQEI